MKQFRNPANIHPPVAGYVHQIEISGNERLLVISGQVGIKEDGTIPTESIEQLSFALENLKRNLEAAGMEILDLIKGTFYLVGEMDAAARANVLQKCFGDFKPCMTLLFVSSLASPLLKVEIDAWASRENIQ